MSDISRISTVITTGSIMGVVHVLAGVDHLSALATLSVGSSWRALKLGIRWGLGHSAGLIIVTMIFIILKGDVNMNFVKQYCDGLVGIFMIALGIHSIFSSIKTYYQNRYADSKRDDNYIGTEVEDDIEEKEHTSSCFERLSNTNMRDSQTQRLVAFGIGIVHGVAGPGGMLGVIPAVEMTHWYASVLYMTSFVLSSTLSMGAFAAAFGEITKRMGANSGVMELFLNVFSAAVSVVVGAVWLILAMSGKLDEFFE